jgi:putative SOS response-associated peptidase YedK
VLATHEDDGVESFAIVTVPAVGIVAPFADRMPAIVDARWLEGELIVLPLDGWRADAEGKHNPNQGELF